MTIQQYKSFLQGYLTALGVSDADIQRIVAKLDDIYVVQGLGPDGFSPTNPMVLC